MSLGVLATAAAGMLAYQSVLAYNKQNPTTGTADPTAGTDVPSEQYATQKNKRFFVQRDGATVFEGMETSTQRMLEGQRLIDQQPDKWQDNPDFIRFINANEGFDDEWSIPESSINEQDSYMDKLYRKWLRKLAHDVGATVDMNLAAAMAENVRSQNEMMSGRTGHLYTMENEIKPLLFRKNTNRGRFSPYKNAIDDSAFMVPQRGMTFAFPPVTRMGVSKWYHLKANSDSGGYYDPTRTAPSRVDKPANTFSAPEGVRTKKLRTSTRQFLGSML